MSALERVGAIIEEASKLRFPNSFNPYADQCAAHDRPGAPNIRRANLAAILSAAAEEPVDELWLALEPTWKGARRTGLAMTDERYLEEHAARWGAVGVRRATDTLRSPKEHTACYVWRALANIPERVFLWNAVPVHTHSPGDYQRNRRHTAAERQACLPLLRKMIAFLQPKLCIAIGDDAGEAFEAADRTCKVVSHPANGKHLQFAEQMQARHKP
jgi:hypothetical protein